MKIVIKSSEFVENDIIAISYFTQKKKMPTKQKYNFFLSAEITS
jgi:hypothetical protein